jgi:hypothetical protein
MTGILDIFQILNRHQLKVLSWDAECDSGSDFRDPPWLGLEVSDEWLAGQRPSSGQNGNNVPAIGLITEQKLNPYPSSRTIHQLRVSLLGADAESMAPSTLPTGIAAAALAQRLVLPDGVVDPDHTLHTPGTMKPRDWRQAVIAFCQMAPRGLVLHHKIVISRDWS